MTMMMTMISGFGQVKMVMMATMTMMMMSGRWASRRRSQWAVRSFCSHYPWSSLLPLSFPQISCAQHDDDHFDDHFDDPLVH